MAASINYVRMFEGGGVHEILRDVYIREVGVSEILTY